MKKRGRPKKARLPTSYTIQDDVTKYMQEPCKFNSKTIIYCTMAIIAAIAIVGIVILGTVSEAKPKTICTDEVILLDVGFIKRVNFETVEWLCTDNVEVSDYRFNGSNLWFEVPSCDRGFEICGKCAVKIRKCE